MNNQTLLTSVQIDKVTEIVILAFEAEISRAANGANQRQLLSKVTQWHYDKDFFTFFTGQAITDLAEEIFAFANTRAFILNITERVSLQLSSSDLQYDERFIGTFAKAIARNKVPYDDSGKSLINKEVQQSIETSEDVISTLLRSNLWLFVTYILIMNLHLSNVYVELVAIMNKTNKTTNG